VKKFLKKWLKKALISLMDKDEKIETTEMKTTVDFVMRLENLPKLCEYQRFLVIESEDGDSLFFVFAKPEDMIGHLVLPSCAVKKEGIPSLIEALTKPSEYLAKMKYDSENKQKEGGK